MGGGGGESQWTVVRRATENPDPENGVLVNFHEAGIFFSSCVPPGVAPYVGSVAGSSTCKRRSFLLT